MTERSQDYWDQVFDQLRRRRLFRVAVAILALLYASAIYAPLIANDRPYVLDAIDYRAYRTAQRTLRPVTLSLGGLLRRGRDGYEAQQGASGAQDWEGALRAEARAAELHVDTLKTYLAEDQVGDLNRFRSLVSDAVEAALRGDAGLASSLADAAKELSKEIATSYTPALEGSDGSGRSLTPVRSYPLFESIGTIEAFFMLLGAWGLLWPIWNRLTNRILLGEDPARIRAMRGRKWLVALGASVAGAALWGATIGGESVFEAAPFKRGLTQGEITAERAYFPPLPFGFAQTSSGEVFRAPTWTALSEKNAEGYYVSGARRPTPDAVTGQLPPGVPVEQLFAEPAPNSGWRHPLGTDSVGRDMLVRMLWGGRVSLSVGLISAVLLVLIGCLVGACAGYFGGRVDLVLSRLIEVVLCFPAFFLILMVVAFTDPNVVPPIIAIVVVIALVRWTGVARLTRAEFLRLREQEFTLAARASGVPVARILLRHLLPNAIGPILVAGTFSVASGILTESALSFLGFGVKHPIPSWGSLVTESSSAEHWWIQLFPGLAIFVTVVCYNLVGDAVRDAVDPKLRVQ